MTIAAHHAAIVLSLATLTDALASASQASCPVGPPTRPAPTLLQSPSRARSLEVAEHRGLRREAVCVSLPDADSLCHQQRLLALARSVTSPNGTSRDLWVLHAANWTPNEAGGLWSELREAGLRTDAQPACPDTIPWRTFGSERSGWSKAAFIQFAKDHTEYDYFWAMEADTFYTGRWFTLFNTFVASSADLLGHWHNEHLKWNSSSPASDILHCSVLGHPCPHRHSRLNRMYWPVLRVSRRFATELASSLSADINGSSGHHEILTEPFCDASSWCTARQFPDAIVGIFRLAGWGPFKEESMATLAQMRVRANSSGLLPPNRVYHPVKCEVDDNSGEVALDYAA